MTRAYPFRCLLLVAALFVMSTETHAKAPNSDIYGTWKIDGVAWAHRTPVSATRAQMFMGKMMIISAEKFSFNGRTCMHPRYKRSIEEKETYFHDGWQADPSRLPLPNPLTVVDTNCGKIYPVRKNHIAIEDKTGVFFSAVRVSAKPGLVPKNVCCRLP